MRLGQGSQGSSYHYEECLSHPRNKERDVSRFQLPSNGGGAIKGFSSLSLSLLYVVDPLLRQISDEFNKQILVQSIPSPYIRGATQPASHLWKAGDLTFQELPFDEFMKAPFSHIAANAETLFPVNVLTDGRMTPSARQSLTEGLLATENLLNYFDRMLLTTSEPERSHYRNFVRDFFLDHSTPFNFGTLKSEDAQSGPLNDLVSTYLRWVATDKYDLFTLEQRGSISWHHHAADTLHLARTATRMSKPSSVDELIANLDAYLQPEGMAQEGDELANRSD